MAEITSAEMEHLVRYKVSMVPKLFIVTVHTYQLVVTSRERLSTSCCVIVRVSEAIGGKWWWWWWVAKLAHEEI